MAAPEIAVIGEALMDIVQTGEDEARLARPGGSPYNVAIGLARLGRHAAFLGRLSRDPLGLMLREHAQRSDVDLAWTIAADEPSTLAVLTLDESGGARYAFGIQGTADFCFTADELAAAPRVPAVHFGSLTSWLPPGDAVVAQYVGHRRDAGATVSYDPNVRPHLQPDAAQARDQVEDAARLAHLVKVSTEDLAWTHPEAAAPEVAQRWLTQGTSAVVVTDGSAGATTYTARGATPCRPPRVDVVDTVGAGDAFMAGLLEALLRRGLLDPASLSSTEFWPEVLADAALVAALTCTRAGADPPRRADLEQLR